ncbi:hypothetical protein BG015_000273 [Linnemannia schmuckeri]|uniref:FAD-binding domain-containing protein n=1 Tax=Linnemannia schmuckeri TaxID=64567 RepID=A0A9P5S6V2_9FUNG|nr:hypothetical protein BG015_000273 [Linnemannia schmuckeri]
MSTNSEKHDVPTSGFKGSDLPPYITDDPPKAFIIGGGLSGLFLGNLLEKANIPYEIFEPAPSKRRPMDDLMKLSRPTQTFNLYTADMGTIAKLIADEVRYDRVLFARPELYDLFLRRILREKIHLSKKLMSLQQNHQGVMAGFSDGSTIHGGALVGADGVHSAVRHHLFNTMKEQGKLPANDMKSMNRGYMCFLGTTNPLDPVKSPGVADEESCNAMNIGDKSSPYTASESNKKMLNNLRHFKIIYGTLDYIFDATNDEGISRFFFEDMLMLPSTGAGAINGMQDAVILANRLYDIQPTSFETIKTALSDYRDECFDNVKSQHSITYMSARLQFDHMQNRQVLKDNVFRPQVNFLPQVPPRGTVKIIPQRPSTRRPEGRRN